MTVSIANLAHSHADFMRFSGSRPGGNEFLTICAAQRRGHRSQRGSRRAAAAGTSTTSASRSPSAPRSSASRSRRATPGRQSSSTGF